MRTAYCSFALSSRSLDLAEGDTTLHWVASDGRSSNFQMTTAGLCQLCWTEQTQFEWLSSTAGLIDDGAR